VIEVRHVTKRYGPVAAVSDVSFRVEAGQILGFLGPNGAGKTTTMRVLTGYLPPTDGTATVAGFDVLEEPIEVKRRTGYLPETPPLYPDMTVREYLTFVARINGLAGAERGRRIDRVMERTSVGDVADRHCAKLSKGYRQRVGLAQAILHNPAVLILDEPTAGLDPKQIIETRELIKELAGDHTIILSTHILPEVAQTCERVVIINKGRVVAEDSPDNLTGRLHGAVTVQLQVDTAGADPTAALQAVPGVLSVSVGDRGNDGRTVEVQSAQDADVRRDLANAIVSSGWGLLEMRRARLSLEEIFLQLTTAEEPASAEETTSAEEPASEENPAGDASPDEPAAATESANE
jgi:ABC-2 type transport system ATP-binding protein